MLYALARSLLFRWDPEVAHDITLKTLNAWEKFHFGRPSAVPTRPVQAMGLTFPNPLGLAAGLDKNGAYIDALARLGFGFIEIGTVTPQAQPGNAKPRLFRLPEQQAIINRMGFNNSGVDQLVENVKKARYRGILGINIGKNAATPIAQALDDYRVCLQKVYPYASYVVINISSPNTQDLRSLQSVVRLDELLNGLMQTREQLAEAHGKAVPLVVKLAPDLADEELGELARVLVKHKVDAIIATNTTITRPGITFTGEGGLSGQPLKARSLAVLQRLKSELGGAIPLIASGGIMSAADAEERLEAGARLVQIYTGLIYQGPQLVADICRRLQSKHDGG